MPSLAKFHGPARRSHRIGAGIGDAGPGGGILVRGLASKARFSGLACATSGKKKDTATPGHGSTSGRARKAGIAAANA